MGTIGVLQYVTQVGAGILFERIYTAEATTAASGAAAAAAVVAVAAAAAAVLAVAAAAHCD